jgi:ParB family transcriptional regulator, chromosome partitioning protein
VIDKKRGLGRGLGALMPSAPAAKPVAPPPPPAVEPSRPVGRALVQAAIEDVYPGPEQPRRVFADALLDELAASIRTHGVIMPLVVRPRPGGGFLLIAGERRWRAAQRAGLDNVPVVVQDVAPKDAFERALVENVQRADLNPIEEATAYQRLISDFGLTQDEVATRVGKDRATVANAVRLLRLPTPVRALVEEGRLGMGHARALLGLPDDQQIETAARQAVARGLTVRATEKLVRDTVSGERAPRGPRATKAIEKTAAVRDLEERLTRATGSPVVIDEDVPGKSGTITLRYLDLDHLDRLLDKLL